VRASNSTNSNSIYESRVPQFNIWVAESNIWVASLSSGHVCEYLASDLIFADGSSLDILPPRPQLDTATPKPTSKKTQTIAVGSKVELTTDYANYLDASSGPLQPGTY
jgi:hypothetical protein